MLSWGMKGARIIPQTRLTTQTLKRLPVYLHYLKTLPAEQAPTISATSLAKALALNDVQVRKDLGIVSGNGRPKVGYDTSVLIADLERALGWKDNDDAVLVGAGKLGRALMSYEGFGGYGLNIVAGFDSDPGVWDTQTKEKQVFPMEKLEDLCRRMGIRIGIITVPAFCAQNVCDRLADCGVKAIWNFTPTHLHVPDGILVHSENMAASLALLTNHLKQADDAAAPIPGNL